ncbi:flagellar basal body rod C-terminal domain-containing protein [Psychromonas sp. MME1]|uniref:flagellar basal body rod C-terminal domain-containing protein n=1 Tax=Psychromonas sp. MME1 TaxID=3231032 RepID=UPI0034E1E21F
MEASLVETNPAKVAAADAQIKANAGETNSGDATMRVSALNNSADPLYMDADNPLQISITSNIAGVITYEIVDKNGTPVTLPTGSTGNFVPPKVPGDVLTGLTVTPDLLTGKAIFNFAGIEVELERGQPASGDTFDLTYNETGDGDNRNILAMGELQNKKIMNGNKATFQDVYSGMLAELGAKTSNADISMQSTAILKNQSYERLQSISGVNMDEEAANLLQYQQHYSAAARVISVAGELFDTILQAAR